MPVLLQAPEHLPFAQPTQPPAIPTPKFNATPATVSKHPSWCTPWSPACSPFTFTATLSKTIPSTRCTPSRCLRSPSPPHQAFTHRGFHPFSVCPGKMVVQSGGSCQTAQPLCPLPEGTSASTTAHSNPQQSTAIHSLCDAIRYGEGTSLLVKHSVFH